MPTELSISCAFANVVHALATKSFDLIFPPKYAPIYSYICDDELMPILDPQPLRRNIRI